MAWSESIALPASNAVDSADHDDWAAALLPARDAVAADPGMPTYRFTLGLAAAATGDLATARDELEQSVAADDLPEAWLDLAAIRQRLGDEAGARDALAKALRLGYWQAADGVAAAWLYLQLGDPASATDALALAIERAPSLAGRSAPRQRPGLCHDPARCPRPDPGERRTGRRLGDRPGERRHREGPGPRGRPARRRAGAGRAGHRRLDRRQGQALVALDARLHDRPRDMETLNWTARVATRLGDTAAADRYHRWGNAVDGHSGTEAAELRVVWERVAGDAIAGSNTAFHSPYVYRRPAPADHLVPWLPRLTYR